MLLDSLANQISSARKFKRNVGTSKFECFEGPLGDLGRTSLARPALTHQRLPLNARSGRSQDVRSGWSNKIFRGRPGDVGRGPGDQH